MQTVNTQRFRKAITKNGTLIISSQFLEKRFGKSNVESYEIPLIELIIRKGMGKRAEDRVAIVHGHYTYKPSQSYINYVSKIIPLRTKSKNY